MCRLVRNPGPGAGSWPLFVVTVSRARDVDPLVQTPTDRDSSQNPVSQSRLWSCQGPFDPSTSTGNVLSLLVSVHCIHSLPRTDHGHTPLLTPTLVLPLTPLDVRLYPTQTRATEGGH